MLMLTSKRPGTCPSKAVPRSFFQTLILFGRVLILNLFPVKSVIFFDSETNGKLISATHAIPGSLAGVAVAFDVIRGSAVRAVIGVDEPIFTHPAAGCLVQELIGQSAKRCTYPEAVRREPAAGRKRI